MARAKNRALDVLRRERTARSFAPELTRQLESEWTLAPTVEEQFTDSAIKDDQLRMMFSCCHPRLSEEVQVTLILNILCGFSVGEIAAAFVSRHAATEKRITRGKKTLATSKGLFEITASTEVSKRLPAVQRALYLLFNEGYHGASPEKVVRVELCHEAMRLTAILLQHSLAQTPATYALAALMSLDAARLPARLDSSGNLSSLFDQDRSQWDQKLVAEGLRLFDLSATGTELTEYHVEAAIASVHAQAQNAQDTNWKAIVQLYDTLMEIRPSPVIALNRAIAIAQYEGPERGIVELQAISDIERLGNYPFYHAALGEFELRSGNRETARQHFQAAFAVARNPMESSFVEQRIGGCESVAPAKRGMQGTY